VNTAELIRNLEPYIPLEIRVDVHAGISSLI
jgi:hypothetical protein